jgi:hypothetical protein
MTTPNSKAASYFQAMKSAMSGLEMLLSAPGSPFRVHDLIAASIAPYVDMLQESFKALEHRSEVSDSFKIDKSSGFPSYQDVLALENDSKSATARLAQIPDMDELKAEMVDHILRRKSFPTAIKAQLAERSYLERVQRGEFFNKHVLPRTIRVSVNRNNGRPYYIVTWGTYDGPSSLPMIYMAVIEDSSERLKRLLVTSDGRLNPEQPIDLPVGGLLNNEFAADFDKFAQSNCDYALSLVTIAKALDERFDYLHPKQLRRFVIGPFYSAAVEGDSAGVAALLEKTRSPRQPEPWMLTWTTQEVFSKNERAARHGLWGLKNPARDEFHIETSSIECAKQGVSSFEKHILLPHDTYSALYANRDAERFFTGFTTHTISGNTVISGV